MINPKQGLVAARVICYAQLIVTCRNINGNTKLSILEGLCTAMSVIPKAHDTQLAAIEAKFKNLASQVLGIDGLDEEEVKALSKIAQTADYLTLEEGRAHGHTNQ